MHYFADIRIENKDYGKRKIPVVIAFDENFLAHAAAMLLSLAEHARQDAVYEIIILYLNLPEAKRKEFEGLMHPYPHLKIVWVDMERSFPDFQYTGAYGKMSYFRLSIPEILESYDKVIYLDTDTIVLEDIAVLYDFPLEGTPLAAVYNGTSYLRLDTGNAEGYNVNLYVYFSQILGLNDAEIARTFNAGVLLMDLSKIRARGDMQQYKANIHRMFQYGDNCLLNIVYKGNQHVMLPFQWNAENFLVDEKMVVNPALLNAQLKARQHPAIVHYTDKPFTAKAWRYDPPLAEHYWYWLAKTPYYAAVRSKFEKDREALGVKPPAGGIRKWLKAIPGMTRLAALLRGRA